MSLFSGGFMKFKLIEGEAKILSDTEVMENLIKRIEVITSAIVLFNNSDWKPEEVAMWLQYEKDLALVESKLYQEEKQQ
jgi:IS30 family transposase